MKFDGVEKANVTVLKNEFVEIETKKKRKKKESNIFIWLIVPIVVGLVVSVSILISNIARSNNFLTSVETVNRSLMIEEI